MTVGREPDALAVGDFNGDGIRTSSSPITAAARHSSVQILLNNGTARFSAETAYTTNMDEPAAVAVGNFNANGNLEVAVANYGNSAVAVLVGNSSGSLVLGRHGHFRHLLAHLHRGGRFQRRRPSGHRRGKLQHSSSTVGILLNNGSGRFASATDYSSRRHRASTASPSPTSTATAIPTWS